MSPLKAPALGSPRFFATAFRIVWRRIRNEPPPALYLVIRPGSIFQVGAVIPEHDAKLVPAECVMVADGRVLLKAGYPDLAAALRGVYGETETSFRLPDLRTTFYV